MSAPVPIRDHVSWPAVCACCGEPATTRRPLAYSLRDPSYRLILITGVVLGLMVATWMMAKVRPTITHELPAPVAFAGLFLSAFAPVWMVAAVTARHRGSVEVPLCDEHADNDLNGIVLTSQGNGRLLVDGLSPALRTALQSAG